MGSIDVSQQRVQNLDALRQRRCEAFPLLGGDHQGYSIQLPRPMHALGIAVNIVCYAVFTDQSPGLLPAPGQFLHPQAVQHLHDALPVRTRHPWRGKGLLVGSCRAVIPLKQTLAPQCRLGVREH